MGIIRKLTIEPILQMYKELLDMLTANPGDQRGHACGPGEIVEEANGLGVGGDCAGAFALGAQGPFERREQVILRMSEERSYALFMFYVIQFSGFHCSYALSPRVMWAMVGEPGLEPGTSVLSGLIPLYAVLHARVKHGKCVSYALLCIPSYLVVPATCTRVSALDFSSDRSLAIPLLQERRTIPSVRHRSLCSKAVQPSGFTLTVREGVMEGVQRLS